VWPFSPFHAFDQDAITDSRLYAFASINSLGPIQILARLEALSEDLDLRYVNIPALAESIMRGVFPHVTTSEIDTLAAETAASMSTQHPDYAKLASRICTSHNHKVTPSLFSEAIRVLNDNGDGFVDPQLADLVQRRADEIDAKVNSTRDLSLTYFGFKTLERAYLLKTELGQVVERPQYLLMRVALGIHCISHGTASDEDADLQAAFETYDLMSEGFFTHASPTLFHAGTTVFLLSGTNVG
jgi:Ribonucleotide reductase, all-alpha domain/ATP cone domain